MEHSQVWVSDLSVCCGRGTMWGSHPKRGCHEIWDEETQLEEKPVRAYEGPRHSCDQAGVDSRLWQEGHGLAAPQAQAVQHHLQEDHVQLV